MLKPSLDRFAVHLCSILPVFDQCLRKKMPFQEGIGMLEIKIKDDYQLSDKVEGSIEIE